MEMSTEEILTVSVVNQSLFDTQGSPGLEDYFNDKSIKGEKLVPGAREVLTEIFKSCAHSEQMLSLTPAKPIKVSDIYLSKEQINSQTPGNLLHLFFTNVRPPKKVLEDQLTQVAAPPCRTCAEPWACLGGSLRTCYHLVLRRS